MISNGVRLKKKHNFQVSNGLTALERNLTENIIINLISFVSMTLLVFGLTGDNYKLMTYILICLLFALKTSGDIWLEVVSFGKNNPALHI